MSRTRKKVRCPKCGEEFEVDIPVIEVSREQVLHEVTYQSSPEATKIWEKRKKELGLE